MRTITIAKTSRLPLAALLALCLASGPALAEGPLPQAVATEAAQSPAPLVIQTQGSFAAGGATRTHPGEFSMADYRNPAGQTTYGDHLYTFYQIPVNARQYPLIFQHGGFQTKRTWETTPDGREGFQNIFLRRGFATYLVDQPRRGAAGNPLEGHMVGPSYTSRMFYTLFRLGEYPGRYPGVQFPADEESLNQYYRQIVPNTGPLDFEVVSDAMAALLERTGPAVLVTHSQGGTVGWRAALKSDSVRGIVAYEPGGSPFLFPEGELPEPVDTAFGKIEGLAVPEAAFSKLTKMPIVIYYGDNIAPEPTSDVGRDQWRGELRLARLFAEAVNRRGGDAQVVHLPEIGIKGNTHFPFSDLNNLEIADLLSKWLADKGLDKSDMPHQGPKRPGAATPVPAADAAK